MLWPIVKHHIKETNSLWVSGENLHKFVNECMMYGTSVKWHCLFFHQANSHNMLDVFFCSVSILMCCPPLHGKQRGTLHISKKIVRNRLKRNGYLLFKVAFQINKQLCLRWLSTRVFEPPDFSFLRAALPGQPGNKRVQKIAHFPYF